jgi:serralysin
VPAITANVTSGDAYTNSLLDNTKWAVNTLTFSFPTSGEYYGPSYGAGEPTSGFEAFNAVQQNAVRQILLQYSKVINFTFSEVTETTTQHGDLRYAESSLPSTAYAYDRPPLSGPIRMLV